MKHLKQTIACGAAVLALTTSALAAPAYGSPAEAAAVVTGKTLEEVLAERPGKSCGMIAAEAGALEAFQAAVRELWEEALAVRVAEGALSQEQADARLDALRQRQETCGGMGCVQGQGRGQGMGRGQGRGMGLRDGSCRIS